MNADLLAFASSDFLRLIEDQGLSAHWSWNFARVPQAWSPGLYRLFGLEPGSAQGSYDLFMDLVHPDDRPVLASFAEVRQGKLPRTREYRIVRPDGQIRALSTRNEIRLSPEGRPLAIYGTLLDVTDLNRLARAREVERRLRNALAVQAQVITYALRVGECPDFDWQGLSLFEPSHEEILADPYVVLAPHFREEVRATLRARRAAGLISQGDAQLRMKGGALAWFHGIDVPIRDATGALIGWAGLVHPVGAITPRAPGALREGLEQCVRGEHLRAARALLDWSMIDLAGASGLSLSTVRRLEEDAAQQTDRSRHRALAALRGAGIRFLATQGAIAVARL